MLTFFTLILGFIPLIWGANVLVNGCTSLVKNSKVSNWTIGLTVVAFGTSTPEISVNLFASFQADNFITMDNVLGSNIFNIAIILGFIFFISPFAIKSEALKLETIFAFLGAIVLLVVSKDRFFNNSATNEISRSEGILMLIFFFVFFLILLNTVKIAPKNDSEQSDFSKPKSISYIIMGLILLISGGQLIVYSTQNFVEYFNVTERIVALIIISAGTSLPELVTAYIASRKGTPELIMGNIVGSNIFNIFFVLGISSIIRDVGVWKSINLDMIIHLIISSLLFVFIFTNNRLFQKINGGLLIVLYLAYVYYLLFIM